MLFSCLTVAVSLAAITVTNGSDEKRILLSDPQYIQQELTRFQAELQQMQVKYNNLQTKYSSQNTQIVNLQTKYSSQNTELENLQTKLNSQITELKNLQSYAGGSYYSSTGAAAEYVCMPNDPIWGPHKDLVYGDYVGFLYGAEYEGPNDLFGMPNYKEDVPCAVCLGRQHTAYLMIPGRTQCYPGWTEVYQGDLASSRHDHPTASQYVCVDGDAQAVPGGGTNDENGKLFYGVKAKCGSLPCPPYEDGKFLSCVVCMK
ncbi:hypothetical protein KP79_PYT25743 [Mizuhopecten yessoensis]|uniref:Short-chain collagen C4 n=1 Tax=Mizuhopecten yessoensis TaxID=6573 RepID=A0A210QLH2_MIZYE|nr:hypothetical protein KP79_PYT25743 [Mizuhopecten yessoensis]